MHFTFLCESATKQVHILLSVVCIPLFLRFNKTKRMPGLSMMSGEWRLCVTGDCGTGHLGSLGCDIYSICERLFNLERISLYSGK